MSNDLPARQDALHEALVRLEAFSYDEMRQWLVARLQGRDVLLPDRGENSLAYGAAIVYPDLSRFAKENLLRATRELLSDLAAGRGWTGQDGEELLLLVQQIAPEQAGDVLATLVASDGFSTLDPDLRYRVLQTLVSLGVQMAPEFWRGIFRQDPRAYAGIAFDGLRLFSFEDAVRLLPLLPEDEDVAELVANAFPGLIDDAMPKDRATIRQLVTNSLLDLRPAIRDAVESFYVDEGQPLDQAPARVDLVDRFGFGELRCCCYTVAAHEWGTFGAPASAAV